MHFTNLSETSLVFYWSKIKDMHVGSTVVHRCDNTRAHFFAHDFHNKNPQARLTSHQHQHHTHNYPRLLPERDSHPCLLLFLPPCIHLILPWPPHWEVTRQESGQRLTRKAAVVVEMVQRDHCCNSQFLSFFFVNRLEKGCDDDNSLLLLPLLPGPSSAY